MNNARRDEIEEIRDNLTSLGYRIAEIVDDITMVVDSVDTSLEEAQA